MRGRKPIPYELKVLRGNPGHRPLKDGTPKPRAGAPKCPAHLDEEARKEWRRIVRELVACNLLTQVDRAALAAYCQMWSRWVKSENKVAASGEVLKSADGGLYQNPFLAVANKALEQMRRFLTEFGLTPASRCRLNVAASDKPEGVSAFARKRQA